MRTRKSTSCYEVCDATLEQEVARRKYMLACLKSDRNPNGSKPYAIAYGVIDSNGRKKLFKKCPVLSTPRTFDTYLKKHKKTVLAVYNR